MKNWKFLTITCIFALLLAMGFTACGGKDKKDTPKATYTSVDIKQNGLSVSQLELEGNQGTSLLFTAVVNGTNKPKQTVSWSIEGNISANTKIESGLLTIAADETKNNVLTITAASTEKPAVSEWVKVKVIEPANYTGVIIKLNGVNVSGDQKNGTQGTSLAFTAEVEGTNITDQTVTWSIEDNSSAETKIVDGTLTIAADETVGGILTITATSNAKNTLSASVEVKVQAAGEGPVDLLGKILILQAYGTGPVGNNGAGASNTFVELYNVTDDDIDLDGVVLWYADGTRPANAGDPAADTDEPWQSMPLTGSIPAKGSFLIVGDDNNASSAAFKFIDYSLTGDIDDPTFNLSNRSFKVVLINGDAELDDDIQNPFDTDGQGATVEGYIDMVGALNDPAAAQPDQILGFETAPARNSASQAVRRKNLTDTDDNSADFIAARYGPTGSGETQLTKEEVEVRRPHNSTETASGWDPFEEPEEPEPGDNTLLILQAGAATDGAITRNFVELYNAGDTDVDLTGYSLQYADGAASSASEDGSWGKITLSGTITSHCSFLIIGAPATTIVSIGTTANDTQYIITDNVGEFDISDTSFVISNRAFKVVLMGNDTLLTVQNPFDTDGNGNKATGYIDMLGATNQDEIRGYETNKFGGMSKQKSVRRISLVDYDNNSTDFIDIDYRGNAAPVDFRTPKSLAYGAWNPITGDKE